MGQSFLQRVGEFGLIEIIREAAHAKKGSVSTGIGDDCAVIDCGRKNLLVSCDAMVEGVHFLKGKIPARFLGWKALASALSDIAAMGGKPTAAFLVLGLRGDEDEKFIAHLIRGILNCARKFDTVLAGGDTVFCPRGMLISFTVLGEGRKERLLFRSGAKAGQLLAVCGALGDAAAGLDLLLHPQNGLCPRVRKRLLRAQLAPLPQLTEGRMLARIGASAAIDISDGLLQDLGHICEESRVGAEIDLEKIPLSRELVQMAALYERDPLDYALSGGEDYRLLFALPAERAGRLMRAVFPKSSRPAIIGRVRARGGVVLRRNGKIQRANPGGFDHFKARSRQ